MKLHPPRPLALLSHTAWAAAALCLSGCAALQIDVDVYKGPLVHDEDTQIQQLASIAMSAKAVMLVQRNKWLDTVSKSWRMKAVALAQRDPSKNVLTRFIRSDEWEGLEVCEHADAKCRDARLINDMLSAYEDKAEPALAHIMGRMRTAHDQYRDAKKDFAAASAKVSGLEAREKATPRDVEAQKRKDHQKALTTARDLQASRLLQSTEALRQTWGTLLDLLTETKQLMANRDNTGLEATERQTVEVVARITDVARLICANPKLPARGELIRSLQLASRALEEEARPQGIKSPASDAADLRAVRQFNGGLRLADVQELRDLKRMMDVPTRSAGCEPSEAISPGAGNRSKGQVGPRPSLSLLPERLGVQREADDDVLKDIDALLRDLEQTNASGFDHGRPPMGLDQLADAAAASRSARRTEHDSKKEATKETGSLADSQQTKQLQDSVVDLASRMQFLAVNLQLVDEPPPTAAPGVTDLFGLVPGPTSQPNQAAQDARAFKATLEVIANTLLVLAEDQRRQRFHRTEQQAFAASEYDSAVLAFQLDPAKRFEHLLEHYRTRKSVAQKTEGDNRTLLENTLRAASKAKTEADKTAAQRLPQLALAITLGGNLLEGATAPLPTEEAKVWAADAERLRALLAAAPTKVSQADLRTLLQTWLKNEAALTGLKDGPRHSRLAAALAALALMEPFNTTPLPRAEALARLDADVAERWGVAKTALEKAQQAARDRQTELTTAQTALDTFKKTAPPSSRVQKALDAVQAMRATVLTQAAAARGAHDVDTLTGLVKAQLLLLAADMADVKTEAVAQLEQWAAGTPPPIKLPDGSKNSALDTLNRIEAFLSYTRVDALNRGSTAGAEQATAALDALMARRERMSYLRPASTYLRSALATTGQQTDPALEWSNLLWATVKRLTDENDISKQRERAVRGELDKSFWQNVNKVRVSAGGNSNFAIAKDDVGNWYVKAMGGDLEPMIKAAKNLALFNLGGRVDSNLLRIDELRNKPGRQSGDADDAELKDLLDRKNGAAASAYGSTLQVFADNHTTAVVGLLEEVDTRLKANALAHELAKRWDVTYDGDSARRAVLPSLDSTGGDLAPLQTQALAATGDGLAKTTGTTPSGQLIKALGLLAQQRTQIREKVASLPELLADEIKKDQDQRAAVVAAAKALADAQASRVEPAKELEALQNQFDTAAEARKAELRGALASKQKEVNDMGNHIAAAHTKLVTAQNSAVQTGTALVAARDRQARALAEVDAVWGRTIKDVAARHLRAVEEMETAARVVSQGVQGKTNKP